MTIQTTKTGNDLKREVLKNLFLKASESAPAAALSFAELCEDLDYELSQTYAQPDLTIMWSDACAALRKLIG